MTNLSYPRALGHLDGTVTSVTIALAVHLEFQDGLPELTRELLDEVLGKLLNGQREARVMAEVTA